MKLIYGMIILSLAFVSGQLPDARAHGNHGEGDSHLEQHLSYEEMRLQKEKIASPESSRQEQKEQSSQPQPGIVRTAEALYV